ncbi:MAG: Cys-Xaa-Xaa-Xaa repeat radical SAM target protein [Negativicutes bacterium]|nr:Cys-Xaa-Xaa-Xaa repeat radical SAM target protein [Negativicutes bacterium]
MKPLFSCCIWLRPGTPKRGLLTKSKFKSSKKRKRGMYRMKTDKMSRHEFFVTAGKMVIPTLAIVGLGLAGVAGKPPATVCACGGGCGSSCSSGCGSSCSSGCGSACSGGCGNTCTSSSS